MPPPSPDNEPTFFRRLARLLATTRSTQALLEDLAPLLTAWKVDAYWLGHADADGRLAVDYTSSQVMADYLEALDMPWELGSWARGPTARAIQSGRPAYIADWNQADPGLPFLPIVRRFGWRSTASLPMRVGGHTYVLTLYSRSPATFGRRHGRAQLEELANFLGAVLARDAALEEGKQKLSRMAFHDPLTGLPNRAALDLRIEEALARAERHERLLAVALFDLDDFKPVNDLHGHAAGDALLIELANRLKDVLRKSDFACRLGGDEFVLIMEDLEDLDDLETLLERLHQALTAPVRVDERTQVAVGVSMGVVIYPLCFECSRDAAGTLLRAADQALYQAKENKGRRAHWWSLFEARRPTGGPKAAERKEDEARVPPAYGPAARSVLVRAQAPLAAILQEVIEAVYRRLADQADTSRLINALTPEEQRHHRDRLSDYLQQLTRPDLDQNAHRQAARALGRAHATVGVRPEWVVGASGLILGWLVTGLPPSEALLGILLQRMTVDLQAQLEGHAEIEAAYDKALECIDALVAQRSGFARLAEGSLEALCQIPGVISATLGRPDAKGRYVFEFVAGEPFKAYLERLQAGRAAPIEATPNELGQGPTGRAWRSGRIEHTLNYASDPSLAPWREVARELGVRSQAAVPLAPNGAPQAVLSLYSDRPGGFSSREQRRFLHQIQQHFAKALRRHQHTAQDVLPEITRWKWRTRLDHKDGLVMHYQPLIDLKSGAVAAVEALARLQASSGELVLPGRFLSSFGDSDLRCLFERGLQQALDGLRRWEAQGLTLSLSLNLPVQGLHDSRYLGLVEEALARQSVDPAHLTLEVLESSEIADFGSLDRTLDSFKALGVKLSEDDLGSGYSSLLRLDRLPFDSVKIDQALVRHYLRDPVRTLTFVLHLTRLAQDLGKRVILEGLETPALVEAAAFLGADKGQGYAIARPMPAADLPAWIAAHPPAERPATPSSALGALAVYLANGGGLSALAGRTSFLTDDYLLQRFCTENNPVQAYIHALGEQGAPLLEACGRMTLLAARGVLDDEFEQARRTLLQGLADKARQEG